MFRRVGLLWAPRAVAALLLPTSEKEWRQPAERVPLALLIKLLEEKDATLKAVLEAQKEVLKVKDERLGEKQRHREELAAEKQRNNEEMAAAKNHRECHRQLLQVHTELVREQAALQVARGTISRRSAYELSLSLAFRELHTANPSDFKDPAGVAVPGFPGKGKFNAMLVCDYLLKLTN
jgi:hypothetical protein